MNHVMATAKVYTLTFVVVLLAIELQPGPFFGPEPTWGDKVAGLLPGLALLAIGWLWLLRIRRSVEPL